MASTGAIAAKLETGMKALKAAAERITAAVPEAPALALPQWRDADYERAEQMEALGAWMTGLADLVAPEPVAVTSEDLDQLTVTDAHGVPVAETEPKSKSKKK